MASPYIGRKNPDRLARARWNDYNGRRIYLVTFNAVGGVSPFSSVVAATPGQVATARCELTEIGAIINAEIDNLKSHFPFVSVITSCVMPDHVHLLVFVKEKTDKTLGQIIASLKANCFKAALASDGILRQTIEANGLFQKGFNDGIVYRRGQLENFRRYVDDNPRRYLIRKTHPEYFSRVGNISIDGVPHAFYGNFLLLRRHMISAVRVSRSYSQIELQERQREWEETIGSGGALVSPFISVPEKAVRQNAIERGANIIQLTTNGLPERFKPTGRDFDLCAEGRLLIIAPAAYTTREPRLSRARCLRLNDLASSIAAQSAHLSLRLNR